MCHNMCVWVYMYVYKLMCICLYKSIRTLVLKYIYLCTIHTLTRTRTCTYTCTTHLNQSTQQLRVLHLFSSANFKLSARFFLIPCSLFVRTTLSECEATDTARPEATDAARPRGQDTQGGCYEPKQRLKGGTGPKRGEGLLTMQALLSLCLRM